MRFNIPFLMFTAFSLFSSLCSVSAAATEDLTQLSLDQALKLAVEVSEDIKIKERNIDRINAKYVSTRSLALPKINFEAGTSKLLKASDTEIDMGPMGKFSIAPPKYNTNFSITANQVLFAFGKVGEAIKLADEAIEAEKLSKESTVNEVLYQTKIMYYSSLLSKDAYEIAKSSYTNAIENKESLTKRFSQGRVSRYDNVKMSADIAARIPIVMEAKSAFENSLKSLKTFLNISETSNLILTGGFEKKLPDISLEDSRKAMLSVEPTLLGLQKNVHMSDYLVKINRANFFPTIGAYSAYQYGAESDEAFPSSEKYKTNWIVGLKLTLTLWDSGETYGKYKEAVADRSVAELTKEKTKKLFDLELRSAINEYNSLRDSFKADNEALKLAKDSYQLSQTSFRSGNVTQSQLNDAELMLTQAKVKTQTTLFKLNSLLAKIEKLTKRGL